MEETKFKVLMCGGRYVDANMLEKGIYNCTKPFLYSSDTTIESMIIRAERVKDMNGVCFISEHYFLNLKHCELVDVTLTINP